MRSIQTPTLTIAYTTHGPEDGPPVILLHGFPDDIHAWDAVAPALAERGHRVIVPWLRGYGPTRLRNPFIPRSGQQAALGQDLKDLMDALNIERATLAGYDWGGRAACIVAAIWPERVHALVSATGYNIQHIATANAPAAPKDELRLWYQWYLHTERGRAGLTANRRDFCRLLWRMWSPNWAFDAAIFARTAESFDNPEWVDIVIHSYRHRYAIVPGAPAFEALEARLAQQPPITVPTINLYGQADGVRPPTAHDPAAAHFTGPYRRIVIPGAGHFLPQEAPQHVIDAIIAF
jgi:pimeloyl-ACP methyl ester carboxylesterase